MKRKQIIESKKNQFLPNNKKKMIKIKLIKKPYIPILPH